MTAHLRLSLADLAFGLLPLGVAVAGGAVAAWDGPLFPEEEEAIARAVPRRRAEFAAGRRAARAALLSLGLPAGPLPRRPDGPPAWPEGVTGTITHGGGHVLAAVARADTVAALGLDLEPVEPVAPDVAPLIRRPDEEAEPLRLFSAKEAAYKAQFAVSGRLLDFQALRVTFRGDAFAAEFAEAAAPFAPGDRIAGRQAVTGGLLVSAAWLLPGNAPLRRPAPALPPGAA